MEVLPESGQQLLVMAAAAGPRQLGGQELARRPAPTGQAPSGPVAHGPDFGQFSASRVFGIFMDYLAHRRLVVPTIRVGGILGNLEFIFVGHVN